jgi:16S rRNA (cytosine967-C5)-methyltransferase
VALNFLIQWESARGEVSFERSFLKDIRDRAFANELIQGVIRHRSFLDWIIQHATKQKNPPTPLSLRCALRLGCYQLYFLDRTPSYAAIYETVDLVKKTAGIKPSNFANAVLRTVQRKQKTQEPVIPAGSSLKHISISTSHPEWLVNRWLERWGEKKTRKLCQYNNQKPPLTLRVNTLRQDRETLQEILQKEGIVSTPSPLSKDTLFLSKGENFLYSKAFQEGLFYIQDEGAQFISPLLDPTPGERILDVCSTPGGKTTHLAQLMENKGVIVALDLFEKRLSLLKENLKRLGIGIVKTHRMDATKDLSSLGLERFQKVLVDAPCSGLGVLRRHPEGKWKKEERIIQEYSKRQDRILKQVAPLVNPGGFLVYSTCSTEPEENEERIHHFLKDHPHFFKNDIIFSKIPHIEVFRTEEGFFSTLWNSHNMDFFFAAVLQKYPGEAQ